MNIFGIKIYFPVEKFYRLWHKPHLQTFLLVVVMVEPGDKYSAVPIGLTQNVYV
jgi:hypothetical protein